MGKVIDFKKKTPLMDVASNLNPQYPTLEQIQSMQVFMKMWFGAPYLHMMVSPGPDENSRTTVYLTPLNKDLTCMNPLKYLYYRYIKRIALGTIKKYPCAWFMETWSNNCRMNMEVTRSVPELPNEGDGACK